jgi:NADH-quinone oxidoreductase subunit J
MSIEVILFVVIGAVAVVSAVMMLLSQNAVHSALFLILNFFCIALLFLLLEAPFLALVQIAVYAGAIMVLFLFVIMLLGAERVRQTTRRFKWMPPVVLTLSLAFLIAVSVAVLRGQIDSVQPAPPDPLLRFVHAAPDFDAVDVYLNGELVMAGVGFRGASDYETLPAGSYNVALNDAGDDPGAAIPLATVELEPGQARTLVAYGELLPALAVVEDDLSSISGRNTRLTVFNAFTGAPAVSLVETRGDFTIPAGETPPIVVENLEQGAASETEIRESGPKSWAFAEGEDPEALLLPLRGLELERGVSQVLVLTGEREAITNVLLPVTVPAASPTIAQFGSPTSIGQLLFIDYVLPFQMVAMLLLAAMIGAIVLTQRAEAPPKPGRLTRRRVSRPLTSVIASQTGHDVHGQASERPRLGEPDAGERSESGD